MNVVTLLIYYNYDELIVEFFDAESFHFDHNIPTEGPRHLS